MGDGRRSGGKSVHVSAGTRTGACSSGEGVARGGRCVCTWDFLGNMERRKGQDDAGDHTLRDGQKK